MQQIGTQVTVLIVEDFGDSREMLRLLFETANYRVLTASDGSEALALAVRNHIDLVMTDYGLPDISGPTLIRRLRNQSDGLKQVPIIMITAFEGDEYRDLAIEAGCNQVLVKPVDFGRLQETIERLLKGTNKKHDDLWPAGQ